MSTILPIGLAIAIIGLATRTVVGRWGYSGENDSPMFGDFEAQRHWMEVTTSLPIGDWYRQTTDNDLQYWGLDYPPLTAYISWIYGTSASYIYPDLVQLHTSRGFEDPAGKVYMRSTVLLADILIFIPAFTYCLELLLMKSQVISTSHRKWKYASSFLLLVCLSSPSTVLVDHGHFQYNGVCIGLSLWAIVAIFHDKDVAGSILFCLALNFKQMALYYAPVFFFILLRKCIEKTTHMKSLYHLFKIGGSVIFTFIALWWPFCVYAAENETCGSSLLHVLSRQFPFSRGIFEDKVANIWYCLSILCDFRQFFSIPQMARLSLCLTLLLISPIGYDLLKKKYTPTRVVLALLNCSLAFFLASFQVLGAFTMFPLLSRDGLKIPYFAMIATFISLLVLYREAKKIDLQDNTIKNETVPLIDEDADALTDLLNILMKNEERHQRNLELLNLQLKVTRQKKDLLEKFPALYGTFDKNESPINMLYEEKRILDTIMKDLENHHRYLSNFVKQNVKESNSIENWKCNIEWCREILKTSFRDVGKKCGEMLDNSGDINSLEDIYTHVAPIVEACEISATVANIPIMDGKSIKITSHNFKEGDQTKDDMLAEIEEFFFQSNPRLELLIITFSYLGMIVLHLMEAFVRPPERYPDFYAALFSLFGAVNLFVIYCCGVYWQWHESDKKSGFF